MQRKPKHMQTTKTAKISWRSNRLNGRNNNWNKYPIPAITKLPLLVSDKFRLEKRTRGRARSGDNFRSRLCAEREAAFVGKIATAGMGAAFVRSGVTISPSGANAEAASRRFHLPTAGRTLLPVRSLNV
jgi:hypothetical protein